jgi:hypothetical protein
MDDVVSLLTTLIELRNDLPVIISLADGEEKINHQCAASLYSIISYILGQQAVLCALRPDQIRGGAQDNRSPPLESAAPLAVPIPGIVAIAISCSSSAYGEQAMQEGRKASLDQCRFNTSSMLPSYGPLIGAGCPVPLLVCILRPKRVGGSLRSHTTGAEKGGMAELDNAVLRWYSSGARGIGCCSADALHQVRDVLLSDGDVQPGRPQAATYRSSSL